MCSAVPPNTVGRIQAEHSCYQGERPRWLSTLPGKLGNLPKRVCLRKTLIYLSIVIEILNNVFSMVFLVLELIETSAFQSFDQLSWQVTDTQSLKSQHKVSSTGMGNGEGTEGKVVILGENHLVHVPLCSIPAEAQARSLSVSAGRAVYSPRGYFPRQTRLFHDYD